MRERKRTKSPTVSLPSAISCTGGRLLQSLANSKTSQLKAELAYSMLLVDLLHKQYCKLHMENKDCAKDLEDLVESTGHRKVQSLCLRSEQHML